VNSPPKPTGARRTRQNRQSPSDEHDEDAVVVPPARTRMTSESAPAGQFHWTTRYLELAAVAPEPRLRQRFLRMARSFQVDVALLANSRATIAESRRLLATVEHSASGIQGYKARHREATMVPARQIALDVAELGAETG
jgi:transposase